MTEELGVIGERLRVCANDEEDPTIEVIPFYGQFAELNVAEAAELRDLLTAWIDRTLDKKLSRVPNPQRP